MAKTRERTFTAEDWKALYFVYVLYEQVALHGKPALDAFLASRGHPTPKESR